MVSFWIRRNFHKTKQRKSSTSIYFFMWQKHIIFRHLIWKSCDRYCLWMNKKYRDNSFLKCWKTTLELKSWNSIVGEEKNSMSITMVCNLECLATFFSFFFEFCTYFTFWVIGPDHEINSLRIYYQKQISKCIIQKSHPKEFLGSCFTFTHNTFLQNLFFKNHWNDFTKSQYKYPESIIHSP